MAFSYLWKPGILFQVNFGGVKGGGGFTDNVLLRTVYDFADQNLTNTANVKGCVQKSVHLAESQTKPVNTLSKITDSIIMFQEQYFKGSFSLRLR